MLTHPHPETAVLMVILFAVVGTILFAMLAYAVGQLDKDGRGTAADVGLLRGLAHTNRKDMESFDRRIHALERREIDKWRRMEEWRGDWEAEIRTAFDRLRSEEAPAPQPERDPVVIDLEPVDPVPVPDLKPKPRPDNPGLPTFPVEPPRREPQPPRDDAAEARDAETLRALTVMLGPNARHRPEFAWMDPGKPTPQTTPPQTDPHAFYDAAWADWQGPEVPR